MKANYHKENDMETCIISVMKIKITMTSQEKMVKKDDKGRSYLRCKVKYEINNAFDYFLEVLREAAVYAQNSEWEELFDEI